MGRRRRRPHPQSLGALSRLSRDSAGIEPEWTLEAAGDVHRVVRDPDPRSRAAYVRIIGYSPGADFVLTVIVDPDDWSGVTAWKTRGADLREYLEDRESD